MTKPIRLMSPHNAATVFRRLAVLRRGIKSARAEIEALCEASGVPQAPPYKDSLVCQLREAATCLEQAELLLKPMAKERDRDLRTMRPLQEARP
jgi:hypothetical protein